MGTCFGGVWRSARRSLGWSHCLLFLAFLVKRRVGIVRYSYSMRGALVAGYMGTAAFLLLLYCFLASRSAFLNARLRISMCMPRLTLTTTWLRSPKNLDKNHCISPWLQ